MQLKTGLESLPDEILVKILKNLPKEELLSVTITSKRLCELSQNVLFENIKLTEVKYNKVKVLNWISLGITDVHQDWNIVTPFEFWKIMNIYRFNGDLIRNIEIEVKLSEIFINKILLFAPKATIHYRFCGVESNLSNFFFLKYLNKPQNRIHLSSLTLDNAEHLFTIDSCYLEQLSLKGNPMVLQKQFKKITGLKQISIEFEGDPLGIELIPFNFNIENIKNFQIKFCLSYLVKDRPRFINEIDNFLLNLNLTNLQKLSIFSQDIRRNNNCYKELLPNFNEFICKIPSLKTLHLSIGCERSLTDFKQSLEKHCETLERLVWIGNLDYKYNLCFNLYKFDMINGIQLNSIGNRLHSFNHLSQNAEQTHNIKDFIDDMCRIGASRGKNYYHLNHINMCQGLSCDNKRLVSSITQELQGSLTCYKKLRYIVINGLHFALVPSYDEQFRIVPIYD